jgi:hypothetical protein
VAPRRRHRCRGCITQLHLVSAAARQWPQLTCGRCISGSELRWVGGIRHRCRRVAGRGISHRGTIRVRRPRMLHVHAVRRWAAVIGVPHRHHRSMRGWIRVPAVWRPAGHCWVTLVMGLLGVDDRLLHRWNRMLQLGVERLHRTRWRSDCSWERRRCRLLLMSDRMTCDKLHSVAKRRRAVRWTQRKVPGEHCVASALAAGLACS